MPFSTANLALVAYALVDANGNADEINSGGSIVHVGTGIYNVILPGKEGAQETLQQGQGNAPNGFRRDLIFACPAGGSPLMVGTNDTDEFTKTFQFGDGSGGTPTDTDFALVILRPTIPTPTDLNNDQDGPL